MTTIQQTIRLHAIQHRFCHSKAVYRAFLGGRGSGKSWAGAYDLIRRAQPNRHYLVASPTWGMMSDTTWPTFKDVATTLHVWNPDAINKSEHNVTLPNGAEIRFRSADNPDRLRGPNLSGCWMDEASLMDHDAYLITLAALREGGERGWLAATFTPRGLSHWTYEQFGKDNADTEVFTACMADNPFLPPDLQRQLTQQYGLRGILAQQELGGQFVALEGAEWPASYFEQILYDQLPITDQDTFCRILAIDPSMGKNAKTGDYSALLDIIADRKMNLWVDNSVLLRMTSQQVEDTAVSILTTTPVHQAIIECNGFQEILADNIGLKYPGAPIQKHTNTMDKEVRIRMVLTPYLASKRIHLKNTPHNQILLSQLRDFPIADHDDGPDALTLGAMAFANLIRHQWPRTPTTPLASRPRLQVRS